MNRSTSGKALGRVGKLFAQRGFTLIELMMGVAIVGVLASMAIPVYGDYIVRAKMAEGLVLLTGQKTRIASYHTDNGSLPKTLADLDLGTGSAKGSAKRRQSFRDVFGYDSDMWRLVQLQNSGSKGEGKNVNKSLRSTLMLRSHRKPAWGNQEIRLSLQTKVEEGSTRFRCVVNAKAQLKKFVPANCRDGWEKDWQW